MKAASLAKIDIVATVRGKFEGVLRRREWGGSPKSAIDNIFGARWNHPLGDLWVGLSHLIWLARQTGRRLKFSVDPSLAPGPISEREALATEILRLFNAESDVQIVRENITCFLPVHPPRNGRIVWINPRCSSDSGLVAYQFDGIAHSDLNPSFEEISSFLSLFNEGQAVRVGLPKTLSESFHMIERARLFIGVSSGMSHIAASLRKPCFIYFKPGRDAKGRMQDYARLKRWHPYSGTKFFSSAQDLNRLLGQRRCCTDAISIVCSITISSVPLASELPCSFPS
jgi:Glycosyltransferase family 9 (heptosyltransferase)